MKIELWSDRKTISIKDEKSANDSGKVEGRKGERETGRGKRQGESMRLEGVKNNQKPIFRKHKE